MRQEQSIGSRITNSQLWKSFFRHGYPDTERNAALIVVSNVFLHLHPVRLKRHALRVTYTFCLGGLSFFLFLVLTVTGALLMFYYVPSVDQAYQNVRDLDTTVSFGILLRNMHRCAAHAMVITVFLHMMRVFYTGSYKPPREFNWVIGVGLLDADLPALVHRLPAAVGSVVALGGHGRHEHRRRDAAPRPEGAIPPDRRPDHRPGRA